MASTTEDAVDLFDDDEAGDDLFGGEDDAQSEQERSLSDGDLGSGDDENHDDRNRVQRDGSSAEASPNDRPARVMDAEFPRQAVPKPSDGELHIFRIPPFLGLDPKPFDASTFTPPVADHHSTTRSPNFSAHTTANTTIRYRKNRQTRELESNTIMSRWSDGSVTISVGDQSYELMSKPLAPPTGPDKAYQDVLDSHQYVATPYVSCGVLHIVGHITNQYSVKPNKEIQDDALEKLQSGLAAAARGRNKGNDKSGLALIAVNQDPELQKKQAEMAEKERMKAQRRREAAAARADQQAGKVRSGIGGGLTLDELERGVSKMSRTKKKRSAPNRSKRAQHRDDYSTEDDDLPHGKARNNEYDLDDGFLAPSDEELEEDSDGDDESEEEIDEVSEEEEKRKSKKRKTNPLSRGAEADAEGESDIDAEGELDDTAAAIESTAAGDSTAGRGRTRHIIEDDDDE